MSKKKINSFSNIQHNSITRRQFLQNAWGALGALTASTLLPNLSFGSIFQKKTISFRKNKVIIIGIDGMDPFLTETMMQKNELPNLKKLRDANGYRRLGTSNPPQSPVAWANFITGANPGVHGLFDFIHRNPDQQAQPVFSMTETRPGSGYLNWNSYRFQFDFWPFHHQPPQTHLKRQGIPFWDYLDAHGIESVFYDLPSNYPPSVSTYGNHQCLAGMGTPDLLGTYGTYQFFSDAFASEVSMGGGKHIPIQFANHTAVLHLTGPQNIFLQNPTDTVIDFKVHRDIQSQAAVIDIQGQRLVLNVGEWSDWFRVRFDMPLPMWLPDHHVYGLCRFYLKEITPFFQLYVSPINVDPFFPASKLSEPATFVQDIAKTIGPFATLGFQEDHKALSNKVFSDMDFAKQSHHVLQERLKLLDYALSNYTQGLLFFYFSSIDLQSHMFWWDSKKKHPTRSASVADDYFNHLKGVYRQLDGVVGDILSRYKDALILIISDHGFCNFSRQFNLNKWLVQHRYLGPSRATHLMKDVDWAMSCAYGLGINGLYINLKGREKYGIISQGEEREKLLKELTERLLDVRDEDGAKVIRHVYRSDEIYNGSAINGAPDLIIGYNREYRASWDTCLGAITPFVLADNDSAWCADHCADAAVMPGVFFSNRPIKTQFPSLIDLAPTVINVFGLPIPLQMTGSCAI